MHNKKVVILNGPPGSGKGVAARWTCHKLNMVEGEFKQKLFDVAIPISLMTEDQWWEIYNNRTDKDAPNKETPLKQLGGLSQRQLMIKISEEWMKPIHGPDVFGKAAAQFVNTAYNTSGRFIFSDSGFIEEALPVINAVGKENVMLVKLYRKGCSFDGDSRQYLPSELFDVAVDIYNNSTIDEFRKVIVDSVKWFVNDQY